MVIYITYEWWKMVNLNRSINEHQACSNLWNNNTIVTKYFAYKTSTFIIIFSFYTNCILLIFNLILLIQFVQLTSLVTTRHCSSGRCRKWISSGQSYIETYGSCHWLWSAYLGGRNWASASANQHLYAQKWYAFSLDRV